jgi:hypothetical protein
MPTIQESECKEDEEKLKHALQNLDQPQLIEL